jgi:hypothetical protein
MALSGTSGYRPPPGFEGDAPEKPERGMQGG